MGFALSVGWVCLSRWLEAGDFERCRVLALRLLDLEPHHPDLNRVLLKATFELEGQGAAQRLARIHLRTLEQAGFEPPPDLLALLALPTLLQTPLAPLAPLAPLRTGVQGMTPQDLLGSDSVLSALEQYRTLPPAYSEASLLERLALRRRLTVLAMKRINEAFERGDYALAVQVAEALLEGEPLHGAIAETLLSALEELYGLDVAQGRAAHLMTVYRDAGQGIPTFLERYCVPAQLSARGL